MLTHISFSLQMVTTDYKQFLLLILNYVLALILPLIGGQMAMNQGTKIHRAVTRFYNIIIVGKSKIESLLIKSRFEEFKPIIFILISYMTLTILPILAGHKIYRQGVKFQRVLARLYNSVAVFGKYYCLYLLLLGLVYGHVVHRTKSIQNVSDSYGPDAKLLKDFIRLTKKKPLQIKLITKIPVGIYLLPVLFAIGINYVITMLQFNHVI
ncbi:hypothetical protein HF086_017930 [Spodoptera exigua]|uniref:Uncharacterized protein n=1 Tax=Spodoptera exigua TaxID=7107 RepID=A0A922MFC2_SPOEX|nr:hypothetical protein HF086_017930 [Spodoptera exigua]